MLLAGTEWYDTDMDGKLGKRLRASRVEAGYKVADFARLIGRTSKMVWRYEEGRTAAAAAERGRVHRARSGLLERERDHLALVARH